MNLVHVLSCALVALVVTGCPGPMPTDGSVDGRTDGDPTRGDATSPLRMCLQNLARDAGMDASNDVTTADAGIDATVDIGAAADTGIADAPVTSPDAALGPVQLALGDEFTCARMSNGTVACWGSNQDGEMADGTVTSRLMPAPVAGISGAVELASGGRHICVRTSQGALRCWGRDREGQIGSGAQHFMPMLPTTVPCMTDIAQIATGGAHSCARTMLGSLACWGSNDFAQIGDGTTMVRPIPTDVAGVTGAIDIALGDTHSCARMSNGTVRCWGDDTFGQLGIGAAMMTVPVATTIPGLAATDQIALGGFHACAVVQGGTVRCWGHNNAGQLGDGTMSDRFAPVEVAGLGNVVQIALGSAHSCARRMDGSVWCWGWNQSGQLGDAVASVRAMAAPVPGVANAIQVACGGQHSCALLQDHSILCWGDNQRGEIGDGTRLLRTAATAVHIGG